MIYSICGTCLISNEALACFKYQGKRYGLWSCHFDESVTLCIHGFVFDSFDVMQITIDNEIDNKIAYPYRTGTILDDAFLKQIISKKVRFFPFKFE